MIACILSNISAKYYKNPSMLSRVIAKNIGDVFFETQCRVIVLPDTEDRAIVFSCSDLYSSEQHTET